jgi:two-component system C4-dicarboxylate transport response regulator DctD
MTAHVLLVDDDMAVREALAQTLELADLTVIEAGSFVAAKDHITPAFKGVILSDIRMPGRDGFHLLSYARTQDPDLPVILLTGEGDIPMAVQAMGQGAFDFLEKPCAPSDLLAVLERALKTRTLVLDNRRLRALMETGDPAARMIFGTSQLAEGLRVRVRQASGMDTDVLVSGPPGSGVSKIAEVIHLGSARSKGPFVKRAGAGLDMPALHSALEAAQRGCLFIDDILQVPAQSQMALVDALEAGSSVRLIAGSTGDVAAAAQKGALNSELFYRLEVMTVRIPALADRPEDIPVLFQHYVEQAAEQAGLKVPDIPENLLAGLMARSWPGNARALMTQAMRFALQLNDDIDVNQTLGLAEQMAQVEQSLLEQALRRAGGRASAAAEALKLPRKTFYDKLARYGIRAEDFRTE